MRVFGRPPVPGPLRFAHEGVEIHAEVESLPGGFRVGGTLRGRVGRVEIFRAPAPSPILTNNWQSWGPIEKTVPGGRPAGLDERMAEYSRWVFSPVPETAARTTVSDYLVGWEGAVAGFLSSRIAHPFFAVEGGDLVGYLEYFGTALADPVPLEPLVVLGGAPLERLLETYARLAAEENNVRVPLRNPVGWSSWYQYFTNLRPEDVTGNLRLAAAGWPFEVFQIDDGFEADIGDWTRTKAGFGRLDDLARAIRDRGFTAGIWTAPFSASGTSELFGRHPDWFVRGEAGPAVCYRNWEKEIFALDTSHPEAKAWLRETFLALRNAGFSYFKIDFLFAAAMAGARRAAVTPVQAYREGLGVIREAVGEDFVLGCGAPLLPSLGFVEGMRVGEDTAPQWSPALSGVQGPNAKIAIKNPVLRWFMHRRWWLNDPDCLLLRDREVDLAPNERELYARAAGALDAMIIDSDDLGLVPPSGKALFEEALSLRGGRVEVDGVLEDEAYVIRSTGGPRGEIRYAVNLTEEPRTIAGERVAPRSGAFLTG